MNTTSSTTQYNLQDEINKVSIFIYPLSIVLSFITNIVNICVLCSRNLRSSSCTYYFLAFALSSLLYMCEVPVMTFLRLRFGIAVVSSPIGCPLQTFLTIVLPLFISIMLVLASVDRFFVSSSSVRLRNLSKVHVARRIIITTAILSIIYTVPYLVIYYFDGSKTNPCVSDSSTIAVVYLSSRIVLFYIVVPLFMTIFGLLTIRNIQTQMRRVAPMVMNPQRQNRHRRTEGQLARMLIIQIGAYIVFSIPAGVTYTLFTFIPAMNTPFMAGVRLIFTLWQQTIYFFSFFLYSLSSTAYRQELNRMLKLNYFRDQLQLRVTHVVDRHIGPNNTNVNHT